MENKLSEVSLAELELRKKKLIRLAYISGVMIFLCVAAILFLAIKSGNYALIAVACGSALTYIPMWINLNLINKEIQSRKS